MRGDDVHMYGWMYCVRDVDGIVFEGGEGDRRMDGLICLVGTYVGIHGNYR